MPQQPKRVARKNGFQPPMSKNQRFAWCTQSSSTLVFFGIMGTILAKPKAGDLDSTILPLFITQVVAVICGASLWLFLEIHDPSVPSCWGMWLPNTERWTKVRYCAIHRTKIIGLDHHCTWLNTTVGRYNYMPFFLLVVFGVIQFWMQEIIGLIILISQRENMNTKFDGNWTGIQVVLVIHEVGVFCVAGCYTLLLTFHLYLLKLNQNTYDFLLERSKKQKAAKKAKSGGGGAGGAKSSGTNDNKVGATDIVSDQPPPSAASPGDMELGQAGARDSDEIGLDEVKDVDRTSDSDRDASDLHLLAHDTSPR